LDGQPDGLKPRDKGRFWRPSDPAGRNASEVRAGFESGPFRAGGIEPVFACATASVPADRFSGISATRGLFGDGVNSLRRHVRPAFEVILRHRSTPRGEECRISRGEHRGC